MLPETDGQQREIARKSTLVSMLPEREEGEMRRHMPEKGDAT